MCTAFTWQNGDHYLGRNLDLAYSYQETVSITPRNFPLHFRKGPTLDRHYAMIGMAFVQDGYPLYYDAVNEYGLAMAGLHFPGNAVYYEEDAAKDNITPFEFIPWILGQCKNLEEVRTQLSRMNLWNCPFNEDLPLTPLHWLIADKERAITVETMADGMKIHDNPMCLLTNNPPFDFMKHYLTFFRDLSPLPSENRLDKTLDLDIFCGGMAARSLPGDWTSPSRFVKAAFVRGKSIAPKDENSSISQVFHILTAVERPRGCLMLADGRPDITVYSACCNQDTGVYYYTTYDTRRISAVDMRREDLEGREVVSYPLHKEADIYFQN